VLAALDAVILGKPQQLRLALSCLLARGHLLLEDVPGVGKTTLAQALAQVLGLQWQRLQFTADLLPADVLGSTVFERESQRFGFRQGPVFTQLLVADEINRASPRTQSALLEAMEERQVSIDGRPLPLPEPFFVVATQNPSEHSGTFPLPESQLDRFLMRIRMGYPPPALERQLWLEPDRQQRLAGCKPVLQEGELRDLQTAVGRIHVAPPVLDYIAALVAASREDAAWTTGLSPRAAQGLVRAARAWALLAGRAAVLPDDVQAVLPAVADHRLPLRAGALPMAGKAGSGAAAALMQRIPVPD
jgi:MoxR-like ATPase